MQHRVVPTVMAYASLSPGDGAGKGATPADAELRFVLNVVQWLAAEDGCTGDVP